jgi:hypothetical protein
MYNRPGVSLGYHATTLLFGTVTLCGTLVLLVLAAKEAATKSMKVFSLHSAVRIGGTFFGICLTLFWVDPMRVYQIYPLVVAALLDNLSVLLISLICKYAVVKTDSVLRAALSIGTGSNHLRVTALVVAVIEIGVQLGSALLSALLNTEVYLFMAYGVWSAINGGFAVLWVIVMFRLRAFVAANEARLNGLSGQRQSPQASTNAPASASAQMRRPLCVSV